MDLQTRNQYPLAEAVDCSQELQHLLIEIMHIHMTAQGAAAYLLINLQEGCCERTSTTNISAILSYIQRLS